MTRVIMHGCNGYMGQVITRMAKEDPDMEIVAGVDPCAGPDNGYPVYETMEACDIPADVVIDFSSAKAVDALLEQCEKKNLPLVLCTTGLSEEQLEKMRRTSEKVAVLKSANMSLGINLFMNLLKQAAATLAPAGFDIEIVERHHNRKLDSPSGTALALADAVNKGLEEPYSYNLDRSHDRKKREHNEIGIVGIRAGNIVGEHTVIFAGEDEVIEFTHKAYSRNVFAKGALEAARYLSGKAPGLYDMGDVIEQEG